MDQSWGSVEKLVAMEGYEDFADTGVQLQINAHGNQIQCIKQTKKSNKF